MEPPLAWSGSDTVAWRANSPDLPRELGEERALPAPFLVRAATLPGASHFSLNGFASPYPGHSTPDEEQRAQAGFAESHTRQRRRHSQQ